MVFNSFAFAVFFIIVYSLYLLLQGRLNLQNRLLLVASCIFYGWWDWRFLFLMFFTITVDFHVGRALHRTTDNKKRKLFVTLSILSNLSVLGFFKYFNFFMDSFDKLFDLFGLTAQTPLLNIILPVGISFYTFQSMSYVVDVYRSQVESAELFLDYAAYVSYFPQLVAGPIERGAHLLPQMLEPRIIKLDQCYEGSYLIFWGLFKKMFIADNLAQIVDPVFASSGPYNGAIVLLALYAFAFQIYCDFSGYSDIARGLGKCMGFDIMINFNLPYFSTNPSEFWKRWHISLSTWLRDYLYIPLGGNRKGSGLTYRNLALTMLLGGLWHGAQWTFVVWGAYQGLLLIVHRLMSPIFAFFPKIQNRIAQNTWWFIKVFFFFHLVCFGWLFFRAESFTQITAMMQSVIFSFDYSWPTIKPYVIYLSFFIWFLLVIQVLQRYKNNLTILRRFSRPLRFSLYILMFYLIVIWGAFGNKEFIYFQF